MSAFDELDAQLGQKWAEKALSIYAEGGFDSEVAKTLNMTMAMFDRLYQSYPAFEEVVSKGRSDARAWFENLGRKGLVKANGELNHQLWLILMKNRWSYISGDKTDENPNSPAKTLSSDELDQKIASKFKEVAAITASRKQD